MAARTDRLGEGVTTVAIYSRGGGQMVLPIDKPSAVSYNRTRNATSQAAVTITAESHCFADVGRIHPWAHELAIFRNEALVWCGPIRRPLFKRSQVTFPAVDVSGWLARRRIRLHRVTTVARPITSEAELIIERAFEGDDTNVLPHLLVITDPDEAAITRDVRRNSGYYSEDLANLTEQGLAFTVVGRRIILHPVEVPLGRVSALIPEQHLSVDVEVTDEGDALATAYTATSTNDQQATAFAPGQTGGRSTFYGWHDMVTSGGDVEDVAGLRAIARRAVGRAWPLPVSVTVPSGARLTCDAPVLFEHLVPGVLVPIESAVTPRKVAVDQILTEVAVTVDGGGEQVSVSVASPTAIGEVE